MCSERVLHLHFKCVLNGFFINAFIYESLYEQKCYMIHKWIICKCFVSVSDDARFFYVWKSLKQFLSLCKQSHTLHFWHWMYENPILHCLHGCLFSVYAGMWFTLSHLTSCVGLLWTAATFFGGGTINWSRDGLPILHFSACIRLDATCTCFSFLYGLIFLLSKLVQFRSMMILM